MWSAYMGVAAFVLAAALPAVADNDAALDGDVTGSSLSLTSAPTPASVNVAGLPTPTEGSGSTEVTFAPSKPSDATLDPPTSDF